MLAWSYLFNGATSYIFGLYFLIEILVSFVYLNCNKPSKILHLLYIPQDVWPLLPL